jgi:hypothetical protein
MTRVLHGELLTRPASRLWSRRAVLGGAIILTASACGSSTDRGSTKQAQSSGVRGVADVDVGCPPSPDTTPCPRRPLPARLRFVRRDRDAPDVEIRTAEDGTFTVDLPPGRYEVVPDNLTDTPYPQADRMTIEVRQGTITPITVTFDSGVR